MSRRHRAGKLGLGRVQSLGGLVKFHRDDVCSQLSLFISRAYVFPRTLVRAPGVPWGSIGIIVVVVAVVVVVLCVVVLRRVFLQALRCCAVCFFVLGGRFQVRLFVWAFALALALADGPMCVDIELWLLFIHIYMCISFFVPSFHRDIEQRRCRSTRSRQNAWLFSTGSYRVRV